MKKGKKAAGGWKDWKEDARYPSRKRGFAGDGLRRKIAVSGLEQLVAPSAGRKEKLKRRNLYSPLRCRHGVRGELQDSLKKERTGGKRR